MNPVNKKTDKSLSDFQAGIGAAAHTTLDTEKLHLLKEFLFTGSDGRVIGASEVHKLLIKIHDILDSAVPRWVGNTACILAYIFNSVSRKCHEVWACLSLFLQNIKDPVLPSHVCLYSHINLSLAQAHQQSLLGLCQS